MTRARFKGGTALVQIHSTGPVLSSLMDLTTACSKDEKSDSPVRDGAKSDEYMVTTVSMRRKPLMRTAQLL